MARANNSTILQYQLLIIMAIPAQIKVISTTGSQTAKAAKFQGQIFKVGRKVDDVQHELSGATGKTLAILPTDGRKEGQLLLGTNTLAKVEYIYE